MKRIDSENVLVSPSLHDSEVVGFVVDLDGVSRSMRIVLRTEQGLEYNLEFQGIAHLSCQKFYSQNIVAEVLVWDGTSVLAQIENYFSVFGFSSENEMKSTMNLEAKNDWALVHVVPSVGVEIVCLSESFSVSNVTV